MPPPLDPRTSERLAILRLAVKNFFRIDGAQWAGAFAFNAFFSLFPLMILLVTISSFFLDRDTAAKMVIAYTESYVPISGKMLRTVFDVIDGVIKNRGQAGAIASVILVWTAIQCYATLILATNRAWDIAAKNWWGLPLKSLAMLGVTGGAVLFGMTGSALIEMVEGWLYGLGSFVISSSVVFCSLSLFYKVAPRRPTRFSEVWGAALVAAMLLQTIESLFVIYLREFSVLNAVYGAFGGIMALLMWIYLSGSIMIFGACLCAAQAEMRSAPGHRPSDGP
ncbi:MAG: hypothetical protein AUJ52_05035 [Elusimicrobia bacterium CG1_02_63_36]|nr:MAG: hypothetical protein AUJ52_05035 [Elusimicrobia bacterium CG1_02_63_36]PIP83333.1 MAG: hypothetical protein COR54_10225 [Elusimicrobia bacterium CG22_combo_CG10-13_8_21_14_all_63_91]PJA17964.1 MAG: hypothetical protein COX66_02810 [Elusimicrobia bacterium CG_4_10_14_0_2_um_filter_63_34]PJB26391.1 MAG: hypothetical protein CO113_03705 [Elusimicrobia bacterium CG_4_9_14_3_um_filter_62_55]